MSARVRPLHETPRSLGALAALSLVGVACGPGTPPKPATTNTTPTASVRVAPTPPAEDRSKAPPPVGLLAELHVESPWSTATRVGAYAPRVFDSVDVGRLAEMVVGSPLLARRIDFRRPFDVAIAARLKNKTRYEKADMAWAFAIDANELEADLAGVFKLEPLPGGVRKLVPAVADRYRDRNLSHWRHAYVVAPALGGAPYRLVCTFEREAQALDHLTPWLARGASAEANAGAEVRARIDVAEIRKQFHEGYDRARDGVESMGAELAHTGHDELDRTIKRLGKRAGGDLFDFFDETSTIDFVADPRPDTLAITASAKLASATSWTSQVLLSTADSPGGPRAEHRGVFLGSAHSGGYVRATKALVSPAKALEDGFSELIDAVGTDLKWSAKDRAAYAALLPKLGLGTVDRAWIDVKPVSGGKTPDAKADPKPRPVDEEYGESWESRHSLGARLERALGYVNVPGVSLEVEQRPAKEVIEGAKALGVQLAKPSTKDALKALTDGSFTLSAKVAPEAVKGLPAGGFAQKVTLDVSIADAGAVRKGFPRKIELVQVIVPDGDRTWTAWGRSVASAEVLSMIERAQKGGTPSPGLAPLLEPIGGGGGFAALRALVGMATRSSEAYDFLEKLPNSGLDPLILRLSAKRDGQGGTATATLFLPRDAMTSIGMGLNAALRWF